MADEYVNPNAYSALIPGGAGRIFSQIYTPGGIGKKPVVILCHGFPGNERIIDFAVYLREQGYCTVSFHYRGSWGSDGSYSFKGGMDDTESVLDFVMSDPFGCFDTSKVFVLGHSWGGCVAARLLGTRAEIKAGVILMPGDMKYLMTELFHEPGIHDMIAAGFGEGCEWLTDYSLEKMIAEVEAEPERYSLAAYAPGIAGKPFLIANGSLDELITKEKNVLPLVEAVEKLGGPAPVVRTYETDHGFNLNRNAVKEDVSNFLNSCL